MRAFSNNQKGQTIIEALVALTTIMIIISAIAVLMVNGIYNSQYIKSLNLANKYAQQGMEAVRNIQNNDLASFNIADGSYCIATTSAQLLSIGDPNCPVLEQGNYVRTVALDKSVGGTCGSSETKVTVKVTWASTKCPQSNRFCHSSIVVSCLPYQRSGQQP